MYLLVARTGPAAARLVSSLHRITNVPEIVVRLYWGDVGRWERIESALEWRKQKVEGSGGFVLALRTTGRGKKALRGPIETGAGITQGKHGAVPVQGEATVRAWIQATEGTAG